MSSISLISLVEANSIGLLSAESSIDSMDGVTSSGSLGLPESARSVSRIAKVRERPSAIE
jgi:hypothetical protein